MADAAGSFSGASGLSEALSGMGDQLAGSTRVAEEFGGSLDELLPHVHSGAAAISEMADSLGAGQQALLDTGTAVEALQEPLGSTISLLGEAAPPMAAISQHAQSMVEQLAPVGDGFTQIQESLAPSIPLLSQYAESLHNFTPYLNEATNIGGSQFAENMSAFQDAMQNPQPFSMIQGYLDETGQSWSDFTTSIGDGNTQMLHEMASTGDVTHQVLGSMGEDAQQAGKAFSSSVGDTQAFTDQYVAMGDAVAGAGKSVEETGGALASAGEAAGGAMKSMSLGETLMGALGDVGGVVNTVSQFAMPLMAVQMVGMAIGQVAQGIYNSAAIAEGPGAHSMGTFTGSVDALGQTMAKTGETFSESFGQQIMPTLDAMNYSMNQGGSGGLGGTLGGITSFLANTGLIVGGILGTGINPYSMQMIQTGGEGLINQGAQALGLQEPFQGPGPQAQAQINYTQGIAQLPQTVVAQTLQSQLQSATIMADALSPSYLASQDQAGTAQQFLQRQQASYNAAHPVSQQQMLLNYRDQQYTQADQQAYAQYQANPPTYLQGIGQDLSQGNFSGALKNFTEAFGGSGGGGSGSIGSVMLGAGSGTMTSVAQSSGWPSLGSIGQAFQSSAIGQDFSQMFGGAGQTLGGIGNFFSGLFGGGQQQATPSGPIGCFPAGTPVFMANGSEKPIEALQIGDTVLAYDGAKQVTTTVLSLITPPPRQVYELSFSDGNTLTTTNSHPILTPLQGWKALSVKHAKHENPDLPITKLQIGDSVSTIYGACTLISIEKKQIVQVFNITVGDPHTFYANSVLVHNKAESFNAVGAGSQDVQSLEHTFTAKVNWVADGLEHTFQGVANWIGQGLEHAFQAVASWIGQGLEHAFNAVASWIGQGLENTFQGVANWIGQGLENTFQGVANWIGQGLEHAFQGVASWIGQGLEHVFQGAASWLGQNLEHVFTGVASWIGQNLQHTFIGIANWIQQTITTVESSIPAFAQGVQGYSGWAVVGEAGPELVNLNGGSVYPFSNSGGSVSPISLGGGSGGGSAPQAANIAVYLDSQMLTQVLGVSLAQNIRVGMGMRGY